MTIQKKALLGAGVLCSLLLLGLVMQVLLSGEGADLFGRLKRPAPVPGSGPAREDGTGEPEAVPAPAVHEALAPEPAEAGEILDLLRGSYVEAPVLLGMELDKDSLPGLMKQAGTKIVLSSTPVAQTGRTPSLLAVLPGGIGYWRVGDLDKQEIGAFLEEWPKWKAAGVKGVVMDLRKAGHGMPMAQAADMAGLWVNPGLPLFSVQGLNVPQQVFVSERQPLERTRDFPLVAMVGQETRGAGEMLALILQRWAGAVVVGQATPGEAGIYREQKLKSGRYARWVTAGASLPEGGTVLGRPLVPDVHVVPDPQEAELAGLVRKPEALRFHLEDSVVKRHPNLRLRPQADAPVPAETGEEAPEKEAEENSGKKDKKLVDRTLQRAWDVVTGLKAHLRSAALPTG